MLIFFLPGNDADNDNSTDDNKTGGKKPVNGTLDPEVLELRRQIEKLSTEQGSAHRSLSDARSKCNDYEDQMMQINKEMHAAQEWAKSKHLYVRRGVAQKCISHTFHEIPSIVGLKIEKIADQKNS